MQLDYKTEKLPPNFVILGALLIFVGIWRMVLSDWLGVLFVLTGSLLFFIRSGVVIDTEKKRLKQYTGFPGIKTGRWQSISSLETLKITAIRETRKMNVASIGRSSSVLVYKLFMIFPGQKMEIMTGERDVILKRVGQIASALEVPVENGSM